MLSAIDAACSAPVCTREGTGGCFNGRVAGSLSESHSSGAAETIKLDGLIVRTRVASDSEAAPSPKMMQSERKYVSLDRGCHHVKRSGPQSDEKEKVMCMLVGCSAAKNAW